MTALIACTDCAFPLDPAAAPRHPVHDIPPERMAELDALIEAEQAKRDARWEAQVRAEELAAARRARAARARANKTKKSTSGSSRKRGTR